MTAEPKSGLSGLLADVDGGVDEGDEPAAPATSKESESDRTYKTAKVEAARAVQTAMRGSDPEELANAMADFIELCVM